MNPPALQTAFLWYFPSPVSAALNISIPQTPGDCTNRKQAYEEASCSVCLLQESGAAGVTSSWLFKAFLCDPELHAEGAGDKTILQGAAEPSVYLDDSAPSPPPQPRNLPGKAAKGLCPQLTKNGPAS